MGEDAYLDRLDKINEPVKRELGGQRDSAMRSTCGQEHVLVSASASENVKSMNMVT